MNLPLLCHAQETWHLTRLHIKNDGLNRAFSAQADFRTKKPLQLTPLCRVTIKLSAHCHVEAVVKRIQYNGRKLGLSYYTLTFASQLCYSNAKHSENYIHMPLKQICQQLLQRQGIKQQQFLADDKIITYVTQYQQIDWQFLQWLLAQHNLYLYENRQGQFVICHKLSQVAPAQLLQFNTLNMNTTDKTVVYARTFIENAHGRQYYFKSLYTDLQAGQVIHFSDNNYLYNKSFRILSLNHFFDDGKYHNEITAQPLHDPNQHPTSQHFIAKNVSARVSKTNENILDRQGNYTLKFAFDKNHPLSNIPRRQDFIRHHGGGMHFPLPQNSQVLVAYLEQDAQRPVIIAQQPSITQPSVVNNDNASQYVIQTPVQCRFMLDEKNRAVELQANSAKICLQPQGVFINTSTNSINVFCKQHFHLNSGKHLSNHCHTWKYIMHNDHECIVKKGRIILHAKQHLTLNANTLQWQCQTLNAKISQQFDWQSQRLSINIQENFDGQIQQQLSITGANINLSAQGQFLLGNGIKLNQQNIKFSGKKLQIDTAKLTLHGHSQLHLTRK